jgi:hypothetical protein
VLLCKSVLALDIIFVRTLLSCLKSVFLKVRGRN